MAVDEVPGRVVVAGGLVVAWPIPRTEFVPFSAFNSGAETVALGKWVAESQRSLLPKSQGDFSFLQPFGESQGGFPVMVGVSQDQMQVVRLDPRLFGCPGCPDRV